MGYNWQQTKMKRLLIIIVGFMLCSLMTSCYTTRLVPVGNQEITEIWRGQTKKDIIYKFGPPTRETSDGDNGTIFHKCCDGKGPTVTICKSDKGQIFGGYVTVPFSSDNKVHYDDKAFLFSLTNNKKFSIKTKEPAVCHLYYMGPLFGNIHKEDLAIPQYGLRGKRNLSEPNSYEFRREDLIGTEEKNQNFMLDEYEVFLVN
jgi:hypothetical protein